MIEAHGAVTLNRDAANRVYAGNTPIRLNSVQIVTPYDGRFDVVAADDFGTAGGKQVVLRRIGGGLTVWQMDAGWNRIATLTGSDVRDSTAWNALEAKFGVDFDGDGTAG